MKKQMRRRKIGCFQDGNAERICALKMKTGRGGTTVGFGKKMENKVSEEAFWQTDNAFHIPVTFAW